MATLVLTTIGTALGGSVGGALGGLIGQSIDQGLFGPGVRKGPRLGDLSVQSSSYGSSIAQVYGAMRVAGTVVWATDLIEEEVLEGGGKGSPERTSFSYSANLAVALSSRPIIGVGRIWADGKLIRGVGGDFKVRTKFRLADGSADQAPDPLISSIEGIANTPAYRGLALAIFEDLSLAEFGNRIPLLTFELFADEGPVPLDVLLEEASGGIIRISDPGEVVGFAAHGTSIRDALNDLIELNGVKLVSGEEQLRSPPLVVRTLIAADELGCEVGGPGAPKVERRRMPAGEMVANLGVSFYDPERDYQVGQATASSGKDGAREKRLELPAVITAAEGRRLAEQALAREWIEGERLTLRLPPTRMGLRPGDELQLAGASSSWIARSVVIEGMAVIVEAERAAVRVGPPPSDGGRPISEPDVRVGRSELAVFELPFDGDVVGGTPVIHVTGANDGQWKSIPVELTLGDQPLPGLAIVRRAVVGRCLTVLHARAPHVVDERSHVIVQLANSGQILLNADLDALAAGANQALIGDELVQFGRAEQLGAGLFRLSKLLRGRRGTEWAAPTHAPGEPFCMIEPSRLVAVPLAASAIGGALTAVAHGIGDTAPLPSTSRAVTGEAMRPPPPCHLTATKSGPDVEVRWVRRSPRSWAWIDGIGDAVDSFPELYRISVEGPGGTRQFETADRSILLSGSQIPGHAGQSIHLSVATAGPAAWSHDARATLTI